MNEPDYIPSAEETQQFEKNLQAILATVGKHVVTPTTNTQIKGAHGMGRKGRQRLAMWAQSTAQANAQASAKRSAKLHEKKEHAAMVIGPAKEGSTPTTSVEVDVELEERLQAAEEDAEIKKTFEENPEIVEAFKAAAGDPAIEAATREAWRQEGWGIYNVGKLE